MPVYLHALILCAPYNCMHLLAAKKEEGLYLATCWQQILQAQMPLLQSEVHWSSADNM